MRAGPARLRRIGDAAAVFDPRDWQTHVLTPAAFAVADLLLEHLDAGPLSSEAVAALLRDELQLDAGTPEIARLLDSFVEIGIVGA
jgi:PqqD family protein of HPr-rel-A system